MTQKAGTFNRTTNRGTKVCPGCKKNCQEANIDRGNGHCYDCNDRSSDENSILDGDMTREQFVAKWNRQPEV